MSRDQAESLTRSMTEIMCVNKEKIAEQFVSKASLEKVSQLPFSLQCQSKAVDLWLPSLQATIWCVLMRVKQGTWLMSRGPAPA